MQSNANKISDSDDSDFLDSKHNKTWMLGLYGTAIGAGTLFLPIDAGLYGFWSLLLLMILSFPITFYSHQALSRFVQSGSGKHDDITNVVREHFGASAGTLLVFLYFFAIYPILLMYGVAITNTTESFIINQLHLSAPPRALLALVLILSLMAVIRLGQDAIVRFMSILVYPFIITLIVLSFYLVPYWNNAIFVYDPSVNSQNDLKSLWLLIPVLVFSFNHSPIISSFAVSQKERYSREFDCKSTKILRNSHILMVGTVLFFVISSVLSLSPADLMKAKQQNISILSYIANHFNVPSISLIAPIIAYIAIAKSYLGHYLGASEGLHGILNSICALKNVREKHIKFFIEIFIILSCWLVATMNPNILVMIETLCGPVIALILCLMPMYAIAKIPALQKYKKPVANSFIILIGTIAFSASLYGILL